MKTKGLFHSGNCREELWLAELLPCMLKAFKEALSGAPDGDESMLSSLPSWI